MAEKATFVHAESGTRKVLQLRHATPAKLVMVFGLREAPQWLTRADTKEVVFAEGSAEEPYSDLEPGAEYEFSTSKSDGAPEAPIAAPTMPPRLADKVDEDDIQRAMVCCQAIYQDGPEKVVQFLNKPENLCLHDFGEVCVSRYGRLTYMLAETDDKDELFIAFRGTKSYEDILSDLSIWQRSIDGSTIAGKCHNGFLALASCFPVDPILRKYVYGRDVDDCVRIVVCGHSMGGAVAHIVTLNMLADLKRCSRDTEKVLSIAVGAPFFGDVEMRNYAEKHDLSDNLLTIVNQNDPVPRLLQLAEAFQCATEAGTKKLQGIVNKTLPIVKKALQALSYTGIAGPAFATAATAIARVEELPAYVERISQTLTGHVKDLDDTLQYTPLGWYMLITHYRPPGTGQENRWYTSFIKAAGEIVRAMGETGKLDLSTNGLKEHMVKGYATVYPKTTLLGKPTTFSASREVVQYNPFPVIIETVSLTNIGPEGSRKQRKLRIRINGKHLDFFVLAPFTGIPADMEKPIQPAVNDDEVTLECELLEDIPWDGVPKVHFTTHFDVTDIPIKPAMVKEARGLTLSECAVNDLKPAVLVKAIQQSLSNILLAPNREEETGSNVIFKLLNRLDGQRKSVRRGGNVVKLRDIIDNARSLNDLNTQNLAQVVKEILEECGQYLEVEYPESFLQWLTSFKGMVTIAGVVAAAAAGGAVSLVFGGFALSGAAGVAGAAAGSEAATALVAVATAGISGIAANPLKAAAFAALSETQDGQFRDTILAATSWLFRKEEQNYLAVLRMLIQELPEPPTEQEESDSADESVYNLERTLYKKCKGLKFLNKTADDIMKTKPFEASKMLKDATEESQKEALRRCQMACDLFEIRQHLRKSCFVGLFGPQNSGKSTLIAKVWDVAVPAAERGYRAHTTAPRLYRARGTERMVIIDFPGTTSMDEQIANLANSCGGLSSVLILVMPFQGDTSTDHVTQLEKARALAKDYNCCILLCISQCGRFKDILKDKKTVDAYREDYMKSLDMEPADILFTELVESVADLESRGIVGPEGVRNWLKDWLKKYDVFEDDDDQLYAAVNMTRE